MHEHGLGTETHPVGGDPSSFRARAQAVHLSKAAKFDRRETEIFRKRTNLRGGAVVVARQEHDSPATVYGRVLLKDGSNQMVEAFHQFGSGERLRDDGRGRDTIQFLERG